MLNLQVLQEELIKLDAKAAEGYENYLQEAAKQKVYFPEFLLNSGVFKLKDLRTAVAKALNVKECTVLPLDLRAMTGRYLPIKMAETQKIVILDDSNNKIQLVTSRPDNVEILRNLEKKVNKPVEVMFAFNDEVVTSLTDPKKQLDDNFEEVKLNALEDITSIESLKNSSKLLDIILINALENKASDIHIEPHEEKLIIRFRVDGDLKDIAELPLELAEIIDTRIKVLADLRIDEHQKPQDGRFKMDLPNGQEITTRVSILPVYKGEKIVMRILESNKQKIQLEDLGYSEANQNIIYGNIVKSHGMILVTGPTGSGKTTTLYTVLKLLNQPDVNLMTVEDPIEYRLDRVNQIQVNEAAGLSFADGLRSILRQDPDVVMVGEIRDQETANIAVNAALTGHLVLATLHTNSAIDTLPRLLEMGVEPFLVASTVNIVVAQRLVRKLCDDCKKAVLFDEKYLAEFINEKSDFASDMLKYSSQYLPAGTTVYEPVGCDKCNNVGYQGRLALAEVLDVNDDIKKLIYAKKAPNEIYDQAKTLGFKVLLEDGLDKVAKGWVGLEEIVRVLKE